MIYQLLKRDDVWRILPYCVVGSLLAYPLMGTPVARSAWLGGMLGLWSLAAAMFGLQRATRFQAGLPIAARQLFLTRLLSLLGILWLPALAVSGMVLVVTGTADAASALTVAKAVAVWTLATAILHSIRVGELSLPGWMTLAVVFLFPPVSMLVATHVGAATVLAVCLPLSAVLLLRTWRALPKSYQLAPAGRHPKAASVPNAEKRAKTTGRFSQAAAWWPVLHSVFPGLGLFYLPWIFFGAVSGQWVSGSFGVALLWFLARQPSRWLWALPIRPRALLLTILAPILLTLAGGYFAGPRLAKHPIPIPDLNVQVIYLAVILGWALLVVLCIVINDWRRLGRLPKWVRALPALLLVGIPGFVPGILALLTPWAALEQFRSLQRDIPLAISHAIPGGAFGAVAVSVVALAALYWAVEKVFSEPEFTGKPLPPQKFEFLQR